MRRVLFIAVVILLYVPASAATVIPAACIGGIGLWDSPDQVLKAWGAPLRKTKPHPADVVWHYRRSTVVLTRWRREPARNELFVVGISTSNPRQRTTGGIGVGSTSKALNAAFPGSGCNIRQGFCDWITPGRFTTFTLKDGRVTEVDVSLETSYDDGPMGKPDRRCRKT